MSERDYKRPARFLKGALVFTLVVHAVAMGSMALLLLPGVPGGIQASVSDRAAYIAGHPWLWRLGWLPWQVTAASDLLLGVALLCTPWISRRAALFSLVATAAGAAFDQSGQFLWTWQGVEEAARAITSGEAQRYLQFESHVFRLTAGYGPIGYLAGAIGWTWCFAAANLGSRRLMWVATAAWTLFAIGTAPMFLPESLKLGASAEKAVSLGNAAAFVMLMAWLAGITEAVFRRSSPDAEYGSNAPWRHPAFAPVAGVLELAANSRALRAAGHCIPAAAMASDISDVVYVNYLVESAQLERLVQHPLELQRLGPDGRYALFTFLTFRHGHFGPVCFGRLRSLWPSPIQSNWRIHVFNPATGTRGIQFLTTAITSTPHALATRFLTDGVPMHVPKSARLHRDGHGVIGMALDPGKGTSPDVRARFEPLPEPVLEHPWSLCFPTWRDFLAYCVPQEHAMTVESSSGRVMRQEIELNIALDTCLPYSGDVDSRAVRRITGDPPRLCFAVERVKFRFAGQEWDR